MMRRIFLLLGVLVLAGFGLAAADFLRFVDRADKLASVSEAPPSPEAVVALTGSSDARIVEAVKLSQRTRTPLLISGVHIDTRPADIARIAGVPEQIIRNDVTLGYTAADTWGNGEEVADWARLHSLKRIVVVTSDYHMDRALLELHRAMPEAEFSPYAVASSKVPPRDWWKDGAVAKRFAEEWMKFRLSAMVGGEPVASDTLSPSPRSSASASSSPATP
jgi:uncharacterized SAM-binding protein YcdF (DUF218 family)